MPAQIYSLPTGQPINYGIRASRGAFSKAVYRRECHVAQASICID